MIEDKLPPEQRLRLECLNQAVSKANMSKLETSTNSIIDTARKFEGYVSSREETGNE